MSFCQALSNRRLLSLVRSLPVIVKPTQQQTRTIAFSSPSSFLSSRQIKTMSTSSKITPDSILQSNAQWQQEAIQVDEELFKKNAAGQAPPILWLGCSDSRVPESLVCQVKPGDIFVHRNIANQYNESDDSANSALTFGVEALGVEHIIIVGHTSCGGVLASLAGAKGDPLPNSQSMQRFLTPLVNLCVSVRESFGLQKGQEVKDAEEKSKLLKTATEANVKDQVRKVAESKVVQANWAGKKTAFPGEPAVKVKVHGWIHDISNGKLRNLNITVRPPGEN